jgi:hypothetical protein
LWQSSGLENEPGPTHIPGMTPDERKSLLQKGAALMIAFTLGVCVVFLYL